MKDLTKIRIAELICGFDTNKYPVYRNFDQLKSLFAKFSLNMNTNTEFDGYSSDIKQIFFYNNESELFKIVKERIELITESYLKEILICISSRIEFNSDDEHLKSVEILNQILEFENLKIIFKGNLPSIVDLNFNDSISNPDFSKIKELDLLTEDIIEKGKEMSIVYYYLYCIENALRTFINKENNSINIPSKVNNTITKFKQEEVERKYLPIRGDSILYYCDFIQLGDIIFHNWKNVFGKYFPNQNEQWFKVMINELYKIRCLVAHNSYVGENERRSLEVYFNNIISQIK